jgi:hypothetical protein
MNSDAVIHKSYEPEDEQEPVATASFPAGSLIPLKGILFRVMPSSPGTLVLKPAGVTTGEMKRILGHKKAMRAKRAVARTSAYQSRVARFDKWAKRRQSEAFADAIMRP